MTPARRTGPSRQGLLEYVLVVGFLLVAAAGTAILFGDELRAAFGRGRPPPAAPPGVSSAP